MSGTGNWNPLGAIALVGAAVLVAGVFMEWGTATADFFIGEKTMHYTGWEVINDRKLAEMADGIGTVPGIVLLIGVASLPMTAAAVRRCTAGKVLSGACIVGCVSVFYLMNRLMGDIAAADIRIHGFIRVTVELEAGYWICIAGAVLMLLGSLLNLASGIRRDSVPEETAE